MKYEIKENGVVCGGEANLNLKLLGDIYLVEYDGYIKLGKKVFGKFIGKTQDFRGSYRIIKRVLGESFLKKTKTFEVDGILFKKKSDTSFEGTTKGTKITIYLKFDSKDPVDIIKIHAENKIATCEAVKC
jgi:hypothetical protein